MKTTIIYFSATGNCLSTARILKQYYDHCELLDATTLFKQDSIELNSDIIGFICPVYYGSTAYVMMETIRKLNIQNKPYIFLFTTCKGHTGIIANRIEKILNSKGQTLSLARNIIMPGNSWISTKEENEERLQNQGANIEEAMKDILDMKKETYDINIEMKETPIDDPNNFRGIEADEHCIGCGICVSLCPMNNIKIVDNQAIIGNECITCLRCFHWCPKEAIYMKNEEKVARRFKYQHPEVKLKDFKIR